ncbi:HlyD family type I secretion periplasmic adaptor subunit [Sphingopyxis sp. EG6]|uniref:HlyD family type I secretion periplasmic adaptor subunit n=1 Tax=Sphingopyxis sp. EG6 TaxID=1874061 RepID=UPI000DC63D58|nr:HlyD family type I secretion periplasmic adaptor subunit [Sphingopyxis sp. EG6]BBB10556.1 membrane fusion protein of T1SS [Sphingopyxis sp. EG6]
MTTNKENGWRALAIRFGIVKERKAELAGEDAGHVFGEDDDVGLTRSSRVVLIVFAGFVAFLLWAWLADLDEVSTGTGRVVPTMREQVIQSLEGGILADLKVRQDDIVGPGQILARLDPTLTESNVDETAAKYRAALASAARLAAEVNGASLNFPKELNGYSDLIASETRLYHSRRDSLAQSLRWLQEALKQTRSELNISESLISVGAASNVEVLRLRQKVADLELRRADLQSQYMVAAREELAKANAEIETLSATVKGRTDSLSRLILRSPVRGIVKNIEVSTVGGVIPPGGQIMEIIPLDDQLLIEARMSPRDIAFIHPGQRATVKITAYDYAIYGGLEGAVSSISPDTIQDEVKRDEYYYRVFVRTRTNALVNKDGKRFPIVPGMVATVDVHTGSKTVLDYLLKPLNRAREALRER